MAQKILDFQGPSLPMALEMDFAASKSFRPAPFKQNIRYINNYTAGTNKAVFPSSRHMLYIHAYTESTGHSLLYGIPNRPSYNPANPFLKGSDQRENRGVWSNINTRYLVWRCGDGRSFVL